MKKKTYLLKEDAFFVLLKCGFFLSRSGCARMGGGSLSWWMTSCPVIGGGSLSTLRLAYFFISCCLGTIIDKCSYMGGRGFVFEYSSPGHVEYFLHILLKYGCTL